MAGQIVIAAMVVDTEDEAIARGVMADLAAGAEAETADIRWQLYPKTGPHSKVSAALRMPGIQEGQPVIDACERLASLVVAAESLPGAYLNSFIQDDGALFYNRIFDARSETFLRRELLWLDIEAHTHPGRQAQHAALFS